MRSYFSLPLLALALPAAALAQTAEDTQHQDDAANEIVVTALLGRTQADLLSGTSIVAGEELVRALRPTLGESLTSQPGVSATSFGPNASRPVLRGLQGDRVRVLTDGIGSFDVSTTSVDHAVAINPLTADRIEVLRGPAALIFGSSAIGGVVNVIDSRIPRKVPDHGVHVDLIATLGSAARERAISGRVDLPLGGGFVAHVDGSASRTRDIRIGGSVLTPALRAEAIATEDEEIVALADLKGRLPNTASKGNEIAGGLAWIGSNASFGASVSRLENLYGVPVRYETAVHEEEGGATEGFQTSLEEEEGHHGAEAVRLDMRQTRYDVRGEFNPSSGFLDAIKLRAGWAKYRHDELEEDGAIGTSFFARGGEARLDFVQRERNGWTGVSGAQMVRRRLNIVGAEKFLPRSLTEQFGFFTLQSFDLGSTRVEAGGRIERTRQRADADATLGNAALRRSLTAVSGSLGANHEFAPGWRVGINLSHAERAPSAEELFSNGPHAGTQAFEVGNSGFGKERSNGAELTLHADHTSYHLAASLYVNRFSGFIYETPTGAEIDELPVFAFQQDKARQWGFEIDADAKLARIGDVTVTVDGVIDYTRVSIRRNGLSSAAPRIPALRLAGGIGASADHVDLRAEVERVTGQSRVAAFETATPGYTLVNASATFRPMGKDGPLSLVLSANNLFDVTARRHASFLKDYAPLGGRDLRVSLRFEY